MEDLFTKLYDGSAFTFEGIAYDDFDELKGEINNYLSSRECGKVPEENFFAYSGKDMNEYYHLTGDNRYPNDLLFVSFLLDGLDVYKLAMVKINIGARWFDDIVDNNERRENWHVVH